MRYTCVCITVTIVNHSIALPELDHRLLGCVFPAKRTWVKNRTTTNVFQRGTQSPPTIAYVHYACLHPRLVVGANAMNVLVGHFLHIIEKYASTNTRIVQ